MLHTDGAIMVMVMEIGLHPLDRVAKRGEYSSSTAKSLNASTITFAFTPAYIAAASQLVRMCQGIACVSSTWRRAWSTGYCIAHLTLLRAQWCPYSWLSIINRIFHWVSSGEGKQCQNMDKTFAYYA